MRNYTDLQLHILHQAVKTQSKKITTRKEKSAVKIILEDIQNEVADRYNSWDDFIAVVKKGAKVIF